MTGCWPSRYRHAITGNNVISSLGLERRLRAETFYPRSWNNRDGRTGEVLFDMVFGPEAEEKYGPPYLLAHRGDLHEALVSAVPTDCIRLDHRLAGIEQMADGGVRLSFVNGYVTEDPWRPERSRRFHFARYPPTYRCEPLTWETSFAAIEQFSQKPDRDSVGDPAWLSQCSLLGAFDEHHVDHRYYLSRLGVI
jgi:hypothetical protein